jgi:hypothetical protein
MNIFSRNLERIVYFAFLVPIITVAIVSISHVTSWYGLTNNSTWAIYLSFGVEIAALSALAAISVHMGKNVYIPFGIVTLIQLVGNVFYSYQYIDESSEEFKDWVELSNVFFQYIIDENDIVGHKRLLAVFSGGLLPVISLSFLHMLVKLRDQNKAETETPKQVITEEELDRLSIEAGKMEAEESKKIYVPTQRDLDKLEEYLDNLTKVKPTLPSEKLFPKMDSPLPPEEKPKPTKRTYKPRVTPTLLEDTLLNDDVIEQPKPKTNRRKKMNLNLTDLSDNSDEVNRLTYRKRNAEDNQL